jgi:hypothetical protein
LIPPTPVRGDDVKIFEAMKGITMGMRDVAEVLKEGQKKGFSERTLRRAKKKIGARSIPIRGTDGKIQKWVWALPD